MTCMNAISRCCDFVIKNIVSKESLRVIVRMFFFKAEDDIRDVEKSRGLEKVYKRQPGNFGHLKKIPQLYAIPKPLWIFWVQSLQSDSHIVIHSGFQSH